MAHHLRRSLLILAIYIFSTSCTSSDSTKTAPVSTPVTTPVDKSILDYDPQKADKRIDEFMKELHRKHGFNGNILVAKKGKIIYQNTFGWADYLHRDSLKTGSVFELASVSKPFTATAILMLMEEGKLRLDQDVKDFFPNFPYDGITIRLLLTHRSGLMNYVYFTDTIWKKKREGMTNMDVMNLISQYQPMCYSKPNKHFHYNNSNYMILGAIIEKVTGKSYSKFMETRIFKPCGMDYTHVYSKVDYAKIPVDVVGHDRVWKRSVVQNFLDGPIGDKGIYSTVQDLYLFDRGMRMGKLLRQATLDSAYTSHNKLIRGHFGYGYGWRTFSGEGERIVYHTGWWHGFKHIYVRDLNNDVTVILLSNLTNGSLLKLDGLYKIVGMPIVRKGAYLTNGQIAPTHQKETDED